MTGIADPRTMSSAPTRPAPRKESFETAGAHASRRVPVIAPGNRAAEVRSALDGVRHDSASHLVVCEGERFVGLVRLEDLLAASPDTPIADLMDRDAPVVGPGVDQEVAAWHAVSRRESALAVVDGDRRFVGLITPDRLIAVLLAEHEEDLARLGGFLHRTRAARTSSEETASRRFLHRIPWLLVGLAGALLAADIVGWFESQLQRSLMLAFFIPGIVYLADAVGTQTETVVVRGLSIGVPLRRVVRGELLAGVAIGVSLAAVTGLFVWWRWADPRMAACVALALLAACSTATLTAMLLPWAFDALGRDPAFGSGPLATVIQDLLSILIYFGIASAILR